MRSRAWTGILATLGVLSASPVAAAFCRTTTCDPGKDDCSPPPGQECTDVGKPLYWASRCVSFDLQQDATPTVPFDTASAIVHRAFESWLSVDCGDGQGPSITVQDLGPISCDAAEYNKYAGNANIIAFRTESWPYTSATHTLALTTVTFNTQDAHIYDVDIEVNAANVQLTTTDDNVRYDLEAILTHEIGHYFGLAHSGDTKATMFASYQKGTLDLRSLEPDDIAGICEIYPPDRKALACDPSPRRGLQTTCGDGSPPEEGGCAVHPAPRSTSKSVALFGLALLALLASVWHRRAGHSGDDPARAARRAP